MSRLLVTGAGGFIGRALIAALAGDGHGVTALSRSPRPAGLGDGIAWRSGPLAADRLPPDAVLEKQDAIVHLAGLAHSRLPDSANARRDLEAVNVALPLALAARAAALGIERFVFASSAAVHGPESGDRPFTAASPLRPAAPYAASKAEAETKLRAATAASGLDLVVVRPPLVYGPGVKANFARLMGWARRGYPLPAAALNNRRSLIGLSNLCDFLAVAATAPDAAGGTFLVSDGNDLSTGELYRALAACYGRKALFLPLPEALPPLLLGLVGQRQAAVRLFGSLRVDSGPARSLPWQARTDVREELERTVAATLAP